MQVVEAARAWLGTRWQHQGRVRGVGCDCAGLVLEVSRALELHTAEQLAEVEAAVAGYSRQPDGRLRGLCERLLHETTPELMQPGDVLLMRTERDPQHLGIAGPYPAPGEMSLIHASALHRKVVEHRLDAVWRRAVVGVFVLPGVTDE